MSNWTHVAGVIRVDSFSGNLDFDDLIGSEWDYYGNFTKGSKRMPDGSEGSLQKSVWKNPDESCVAKYTVSIFGDLRDHDEPQEIIDWFKEVCDSLWVRQAIITVSNERNGTIDWRYEYDE